jgi:hypothetical protein
MSATPPSGDSSNPNSLYGIIAALFSLVAYLAKKVYASPVRKPPYDNGKRISQQEMVQRLEEALAHLAHHSARLDAFGNRLFQLEIDRDDWSRDYGRKLERLTEEISRVRRKLPPGDLSSSTNDG